MHTAPQGIALFLWHFVKRQPYRFLFIQIASFAWSLDNTLWPYAFKLLLDKLIAYSGDRSDVWIYLLPVLLFWGITWLSIEIMFRVQGWIMAKAFPALEKDIRLSMFNYVSQHSYRYFADHFAGNLSNRISDMTQSSTRIMQLISTLFVPALASLLIACYIFYQIAPVFALLLAGWVCLHIGVCLLAAKMFTRLSAAHADSRSFLTGKIVDVFTNITSVKLFGRRRFEYHDLQQHQQDEQNKNYHSLIVIEKVKVILGILSLIFPGILLTWLEIHSWQQGLISIGDLALIFTASNNVMMVAWFSGLELPNLFKEIGVGQQALDIISQPHEVVDCVNAKTLQPKNNQLVFENVSFAYDKQHNIFNNFNLRIDAGSKVGLVGFSGSGKTTFVNLIMRFYDLQQGRILIDDQDISQQSIHSLRNAIGMIPQEPSLFHRSLMENIRYGNPLASDADVINAAKRAYCHDFIEMLPEGYQTLVGERGIKLSGGQRQRIAIARCLLKDAKLLILDEATSALDSVTEKAIQQTLSLLMQHRTAIIIAHRLSTLAQMDRILVFDQGEIIEEGTHAQLLRHDGHYATMWHMQAGGFLPQALPS